MVYAALQKLAANHSVVISVDDFVEVLLPAASPVWIKPKDGNQKGVAESKTTEHNPTTELGYVI